MGGKVSTCNCWRSGNEDAMDLEYDVSTMTLGTMGGKRNADSDKEEGGRYNGVTNADDPERIDKMNKNNQKLQAKMLEDDDEDERIRAALEAEHAKDDKLLHSVEEGISAVLYLPNNTEVKCFTRIDNSHRFILLFCGTKVRYISINDVKNILYTKRQLKHVDDKSRVHEQVCCVALHLFSSNHCIPLFFENREKKMLFVTAIEKVQKEKKTNK